MYICNIYFCKTYKQSALIVWKYNELFIIFAFMTQFLNKFIYIPRNFQIKFF